MISNRKSHFIYLVDSFLKAILCLVAIHYSILILYAIKTRNIEVINIFRVTSLDLFVKDIGQGEGNFIFSYIFFLALWIFSYLFLTKKK